MINICSVEGCDKPVRHRDLCTTHYKRWWRHGDHTITNTPTRGFERVKCVIEDCNTLSAYSNGLCEIHYQRFNRYGRYHNIIREKGVGCFNSAGYYMVRVNGESVYEHIYKAEKALGKPLPKGAIVHHMNRCKFDNDTPFNLVVCPDQAYHLLLHRRAKELGYEDN